MTAKHTYTNIRLHTIKSLCCCTRWMGLQVILFRLYSICVGGLKRQLPLYCILAFYSTLPILIFSFSWYFSFMLSVSFDICFIGICSVARHCKESVCDQCDRGPAGDFALCSTGRKSTTWETVVAQLWLGKNMCYAQLNDNTWQRRGNSAFQCH